MAELARKNYDVFHVAEARGSEFVPAQDFVEQFNSHGGKPKDGSDLPRLNRARIILEKARQLGLIAH